MNIQRHGIIDFEKVSTQNSKERDVNTAGLDHGINFNNDQNQY